MNRVINDMFLKYNCKTPEDYKNALKEIIQEITLLGLYRQKFFDKVAFYGGSALRIAHKLDRFSEDLDFTLLQSDAGFDIKSYLKGIEEEFASLGLALNIEKKIKNIETKIDSAFIKGNTLEHLLMVQGINNPASGFNKNDMIKIKLEIDTDPPNPSGEAEILFSTRPVPFSFRILTKASLFSGKLHAILCRSYKSGRVKGRDYYDFVWYIDKNIKPDLPYLEAKMRQTNHWAKDDVLKIETVRNLLKKKFDEIDFEQAKADVFPFIKDNRVLDVWSKEFFKALSDRILT